MTDLLDPYVEASADGPSDHDLSPLGVTTEDDRHVPAPFLSSLIAACLTGAGVIHLAMVPAHMSEWAVEGWAFLASAALQLALAVGFVLRPRRWMAALTILSSAAFMAAWWWTRYRTMPFGPLEHTFEAASPVDVTCVILEGGAALVAAITLVRPRLTAGWKAHTIVFASVIPVAALVAGLVAVASPSAGAHTDAAGATGHAHSKDDLGFYLLGNGHHHAIAEHAQDPVTQAELDRQLAITREVAAAHPTVASAEADGYKRAGPYSPGLGAHYTRTGPQELNADGIVDDEDLRHPLSIIYDGNDPDSQVAGFMYYSMSATEPVGFVGTNDTWHTHSNVCVKFGPDGVDSPLGADLPITKEQCEAVGAVLLETTQWMVHVWSVPGYDNTNGGVFSEENPGLACSDGTFFMLPPEQWPDNLMNVCRSKAPGEPRHPV
jgi:hypothetical protein